MNTNYKSQQRGRPPVNIDWPDIVFTAQDVVDTATEKVSRVTIHSKLNKAVDNGTLTVVGVVKSANGRPRVKYKKCAETSNQESVVVVDENDTQQQTYLG
jgi:coenzyme F420-reducing hydrogenase beta subunit